MVKKYLNIPKYTLNYPISAKFWCFQSVFIAFCLLRVFGYFLPWFGPGSKASPIPPPMQTFCQKKFEKFGKKWQIEILGWLKFFEKKFLPNEVLWRKKHSEHINFLEIWNFAWSPKLIFQNASGHNSRKSIFSNSGLVFLKPTEWGLSNDTTLARILRRKNLRTDGRTDRDSAFWVGVFQTIELIQINSIVWN